MDEFDAIAASLATFMKRLDEGDSARFNELRKCSFFDPIPSEWLSHIARHIDIREFSSGDRLTSEDGDMDAFYIVLFGKANAYYNSQIVGTISAGECIGEGMFFASKSITRSATVVADGHVVAAVIRKAGIDNLFNDAQAKTYMDKALLIALFKKLQGANRRIVELLR